MTLNIVFKFVNNFVCVCVLLVPYLQLTKNTIVSM